MPTSSSSTRASTAAKVLAALRRQADKKQAAVLQRFFKTGPGEYGEGDVFLGLKVPQTREIAREFSNLPLSEARKLLARTEHEARLAALLILVEQYGRGSESERARIYAFYLHNIRRINNWDLVDLSADRIVGAHLESRDRAVLRRWARSSHLWTRRIAILSTFHFIKNGKSGDTLEVARLLLNDEHDLIHKAVGWMLREVGKRDIKAEERFLQKHYRKMPRTMLRYAIERFPEKKRKAYLEGRIRQPAESNSGK